MVAESSKKVYDEWDNLPGWGSKRLRTGGYDIKVAKFSSGAPETSLDAPAPVGGSVAGNKQQFHNTASPATVLDAPLPIAALEPQKQEALLITSEVPSAVAFPPEIVKANPVTTAVAAETTTLNAQQQPADPNPSKPQQLQDYADNPLLALCHALSQSTDEDNAAAGSGFATTTSMLPLSTTAAASFLQQQPARNYRNNNQATPAAATTPRAYNSNRRKPATKKSNFSGSSSGSLTNVNSNGGVEKQGPAPLYGAANSTGVTRKKTAAYVGVRRRQWGTYAAEIRNHITGSRE